MCQPFLVRVPLEILGCELVKTFLNCHAPLPPQMRTPTPGICPNSMQSRRIGRRSHAGGNDAGVERFTESRARFQVQVDCHQMTFSLTAPTSVVAIRASLAGCA